VTAAAAGATVGGGLVGKDVYDRVTGRDEIERRLEEERGADRRARDNKIPGEAEARREQFGARRARRRAHRLRELAREREASGPSERGKRATGAAADEPGAAGLREGEVEPGSGEAAPRDPPAQAPAPKQADPGEPGRGPEDRPPLGGKGSAEP
jgi:hypothetical protein